MNLKKISITALIAVSGFVLGQNNNAHPDGIRTNFSQKSIEAYQESSENKLVGFYEYLTIYSNAKDEELKSQVRQNLYSMLESENIKVIDFTGTGHSETSLQSLLSKIEGLNYRFSVKTGVHSNEPGWNEWTNQYELVVKKANADTSFKISQKIKFEPVEKNFGSKSKTVWVMKIGDMISM